MENSSTHPLWSNLFKAKDDQTTEISKLWMASPLFTQIPERICRELVSTMHLRQYEPGEPIFKAGERGAGAVIIRSGTVSVRAGNQELSQLERGDFFGEIALVANEPRTADAISLTKTELVFFLQTDLTEWKEHSPKHGAQFVTNLARVLATRLRESNERISKKAANAE